MKAVTFVSCRRASACRWRWLLVCSAGLLTLTSLPVSAGGFSGTIGGRGAHVRGNVGGVRFRVGHHGSSHRSSHLYHGREYGRGFNRHHGSLGNRYRSYGHPSSRRYYTPRYRSFVGSRYPGRHYGGYYSGPGHYRGQTRYPYDRYGYDCGYAHGYGCGYRVYGFTLPAAKSYGRSHVGRYVTADSADPYLTDAVIEIAAIDRDPRSEGWAMLADGRTHDALPFFARQAREKPEDGVSKVGYALAWALKGDLTTAAWAMRRAFRVDPQSLHDIALADDLWPSVRRVIASYEDERMKSHSGRIDGTFMIAALHYLLHDEKAARLGAANLAMVGDQSRSARNLSRLLGDADDE